SDMYSYDHKFLGDKRSVIPESCFITEKEVIIGEVVLGEECSVWYNDVIRGDEHSISLGNKVNVQDGAVIHATYKVSPTVIGNNVSIRHNAIVHGCTIHDNVHLGQGAIWIENCLIESTNNIAAGVESPKNDS